MRRAGMIGGSIAVSLLINLGLLGVAAVLSGERPLEQDITAPMPVRLVQLQPTEMPEEQPVPEPEKQEPPPPADFAPDLLELPPTIPSLPRVELPRELGLMDFAAPEGAFVFSVADLDQPPQALVRIEPLYPPRAQRFEVEGWVSVRFLVGQDGSVSDVAILAADPEGFFEQSVLTTVPRWRFQPGKIAGRAVAAWVETTIRFEFK